MTWAASHYYMRHFLFLLPALAYSAVLPETIGHWQRGAPGQAPVPNEKVWVEYGLQDSEAAPYSDAGQSFTIQGYRFSDATGAMAAWDAVRPADAKPVALMGLAVETGADQFIAAGNYLLVFKGYKVKPEELSHIVATVPRYGHSPLPTLPKYFPPGGVPNSERYITGPASLAELAPVIPPSTAAFSFSAEGQLVRYITNAKETTLLIFSYPTMEMARKQYPEFQKVPGSVVKRAGPLVAIALNGAVNPAGADDAERLLAQVKYQAEVTLPEHVPTARDNPVNLFWNVFILCLVLAGFCVMSGIVVGGVRVLLRRTGSSGDGDEMISLHLSGRR